MSQYHSHMNKKQLPTTYKNNSRNSSKYEHCSPQQH